MPRHYRISDPSDVRDLGGLMAMWIETGNPKANDWAVYTEPEPKPPQVPQSVSLRQFRMALKRAGLFDAVMAFAEHEAVPPQIRDDIMEFMNYSNTIERNHPLLVDLAPVLNVSSEQVDEIFTLASTL